MSARNSLRARAKKAYREQIKGVPKRHRMPFAKFFKQYKGTHLNAPSDIKDDFNFEDMINMNFIDSEDE